MRKSVQGLLVPVLLAAALGTAHAQLQTRGESATPTATNASAQTGGAQKARSPIVVDGTGWMRATADERRAFLVGVANMIVAENAYAKRRNIDPPGAGTRITQTMGSMNLWQVSERITAWYGANPDKLSTPVMGVIWRDLVEKSK